MGKRWAISILLFLAAAAVWAAPAGPEGSETESAATGDAGRVYALPEQTVVGEVEPVHMTLWQAAVLGVIEGVTEYLPISSTGHLLVAQRWMGLDGGVDTRPLTPSELAAAEEKKSASDAYAVVIQAGAIVAVLGLYFGRVKQGFRGLAGRDEVGRRLAVNLIVAFIPAAVIGLAFEDFIEEHLWGVWPIIAAWAVGGFAILIVSWLGKDRDETDPRPHFDLDHLTWRHALIIGLAQALAMWPGTSRSLVTIVGGVLVGMTLAAAVEFSFLLGVITLGAATCYKAVQVGPLMLELYGWEAIAIGFVTAFISAAIAVKWMVAYLNKHGLALFGYYRVAIAAIVAVLVVMEVL